MYSLQQKVIALVHSNISVIAIACSSLEKLQAVFCNNEVIISSKNMNLPITAIHRYVAT